MKIWTLGLMLGVAMALSTAVSAQAPSQPRPLPANPSVQQLSTACQGRDGEACDELGRRYLAGEGVPVNHAQAFELLNMACNQSNAMGCARLALMHESGQGTPTDMTRAAALYTRGCDGGEAWGCTRLGLMYANGRGVVKDDARAVGLYRRACDAGEAAACSNLGMMMQNARGGAARDDARSAALYKIACDASDSVGCAHLALMYYLGEGVPKSEATAAEIYKKGCDLGGGGGGCLMLGYMYLNGRGVAKNEALALQLFQRGCADAEANACDAARDAAAPKGTGNLMSAGALAGLKTRAMASAGTAPLSPELLTLFGIMPAEPGPGRAKQLSMDIGKVTYLLTFPLLPDSDDVLFTNQEPGLTHFFLSDSSLTLRAAGLLDASGARLITIEQARSDFEKTLSAWAGVVDRK